MKRFRLLLLAMGFSVTAVAETLTFPEGFQWCVATAGHQVEGDNIHSDWWAWEQLPGKIKNGDRSGKASYHREKMEEDIGWMKKLHVTTYRFSVEWSRIEPAPGEFDEKALADYRHELERLKAAGIRPMVTLHHFVQPLWFSESGGFRREDSPELFLNYVKKVDAALGERVPSWITFNEPMVYFFMGYVTGEFPPGEKKFDFFPALVNLLKAHAKAFTYLHEAADRRGQKIQVGVAHHIRPLVTQNALTHWLVKPFDYLLNWNVPEALKSGHLEGFEWTSWWGLPWPRYRKMELPELRNTQDFIGINYYARELIALKITPPFYERKTLPGLPASDMNWSIDPAGFYFSFKKLDEMFPHIPFFVTENGIADATDRWREKYVKWHLREVYRAIHELGHPVEGYCHWSLMDNFEWAEGFWPRFGLLEVDYAHGGARKLRPSAEKISEIFGSNQLVIEDGKP
jgi:beta-glucosidase